LVPMDFTTRQLIWLETCRRRLEHAEDRAAIKAELTRTGRRPRNVGLAWSDLETWTQTNPAGLSAEEADRRAAELEPEVRRLVERWPSLAIANHRERRVVLGHISFLESRRAFMDIEEHVRALTDWVGLKDLFQNGSEDGLLSRAGALLLSYLEIHPGLQL
jgi:hypothetical protein